MGEQLTPEQLARTGWRFHFNNDTLRGRRNVRMLNFVYQRISFCFVFLVEGRKKRKY